MDKAVKSCTSVNSTVIRKKRLKPIDNIERLNDGRSNIVSNILLWVYW